LIAERDTTLRYVARWANPAIVVTLSGSAALNSLVFMQGATGPLAIGAAVLMGRFLPSFIYVLTRALGASLAAHRCWAGRPWGRLLLSGKTTALSNGAALYLPFFLKGRIANEGDYGWPVDGRGASRMRY
jgi:hypothetical protein